MEKRNFQVETATIDDAGEILAIQKDAFQGQARIYNNYQIVPLMQSLESIQHEFKEKKFLKVSINCKIIASVRYKMKDGVVTIDRLIVKPEYQNQGIGTALLHEIESKVSDAVVFQLFTGNKSERNIHLYEKMGYKITKQEKTDEGIELLHMQKWRK